MGRKRGKRTNELEMLEKKEMLRIGEGRETGIRISGGGGGISEVERGGGTIAMGSRVATPPCGN